MRLIIIKVFSVAGMLWICCGLQWRNVGNVARIRPAIQIALSQYTLQTRNTACILPMQAILHDTQAGLHDFFALDFFATEVAFFCS